MLDFPNLLRALFSRLCGKVPEPNPQTSTALADGDRPAPNARQYMRSVASDAVESCRSVQGESGVAEGGSLDFSLLPRPDVLQPAELEKYRAILEAMPAQVRAVFLLRRVDDLDYVSIAAELGISTRRVQRLMGKAINLIADQR